MLNDVSLDRLLAGLLAIQNGDFSVRLPGSRERVLDAIAGAFNEMAARLSEQDAERSRFLPMLSHELRTPLNSMLVLAGLLAANPDGNLTQRQTEYASVIHSAGTDLARVISGMVDSEGITEEPGEPAGSDTERRLLVVETARGGLLTLLARGAVFDLTSPGTDSPGPGGPVVVRTAITSGEVAAALAIGPHMCMVLDLRADETLAFEALALALASRVPVLAHGRGAAERAKLSLLRARAGAGLAEITESPDELRARLAWYMSSAPREQAHRADWAQAGGRAQAGGAAGSQHARREPLAPLRGRKILVVDDDPRNVFAISSTLEHYGMQVISATDGRSGLDALLRAPDTDLVLMDLMMPGMDGYTAISEIRDISEFSDLPVIAVTAHTVTGDLDSQVPGADGYVTKPLDTDELLNQMAFLLAAR